MEENNNVARYVKIAQDLCSKIVSMEFPEGTLLKGRTVLASFYGVSSETIRKSINLLAREGIVQIKRGVGVFVISTLHAQQFQEKWKDETTIKSKYDNLLSLIKEKKNLDDKIDTAIKDMKDSFTFQSNEAVKLLEINVPDDSWILSKTIGSTYFYNYTEATIVAIFRQNGEVYTSPSPDVQFYPNDKIIFVGKDKLTFDRVTAYLVYGADKE